MQGPNVPECGNRNTGTRPVEHRCQVVTHRTVSRLHSEDFTLLRVLILSWYTSTQLSYSVWAWRMQRACFRYSKKLTWL